MKKMIVLPALGLGVSLLLLIATATDAAAQEHAAGCFLSPAKLGDDNISTFLASPASLNTIYPNGGFEMISRIRVLAGSSSETLDPMMALIPQMTAPQKTALGSGLARTARACAALDPTYAQTIQEKVAAANSPEVTTAFLSTLNEVQTAALGPAGAGAGAGGGAAGVGGGAAGDSSGGAGGDSSVATSSGDFTIGSRSRRLATTNVTNITNITEVAGTSPF
jgi:hypothetical protein